MSAGGKPSAVVVGSGFGGLAAAIRLGARGWRVTVVERLDGPGGRACVHRQDGFTFDAGPTIITAPFLLEELWALCGRRLAEDVTLKRLSPGYAIEYSNGDTLQWFDDRDRMAAQIAELAPRDVEGYRRFMRFADECCRIGFERLGHVSFGNWGDMLRALPDLVRLRSYRSLHSVVRGYLKDPRLRFACSFHPLFIGGNPLEVTAIYGLIPSLEQRWGVHYAMGGTGRIVEGMVGLIERQGGSLRFGEEVSEIRVRDGRAVGVRLASGEELDADVTVSNADAAWTYRHLVPVSARRRWTNSRLDKARYSMSLFVWYFGTRRRYPEVGHHTILLSERYEDLLRDIFKHRILPDDFSLYLHRPTATDPSMAPPGCDAFYVLSPVPNLAGGVNWDDQAEDYRRAISRRLSESLLPDLEDSLITSRIATPQDFRKQLLSVNGAGFSLEPVLLQSAWFRPHNRSEDVQGLYLVGAGTHPGAGMPGVLSSAKVLDALIPDADAHALR